MMLNIILDLVLIGILVVGVIIGLKKGFVKVIAKPLKAIFSVVFALAFARAFGAWIIEPIIGEPIFNWISSAIHDNCANLSQNIPVDQLPTLIKFAASLSGVDLNALAGSSEDVISSLVAELSLPLVSIISTAISFVLLVVLARLALIVVFAIVNKVCEAGAFKIVNRVLGCIVCVCVAIFVAWGVVSVFGFVITLPALAETEAIKNFTGGFIYDLFNKYSLIGLLLSF